jgi:hypothetical protein
MVFDPPITPVAGGGAPLGDPGAAVATADRVVRQGRHSAPRRARPYGRVVDRFAPWLVGAATLVARLSTAARGPTDWDSAQYASAVGHFDVTHGLPQPPGYWLYVAVGRLIHETTGAGVIHSLVLLAALASAAGAGLTVVAGRDLGGRWVGLAAGVVVATSPFAWFSGSIVATYSFDLLACAALLLLAWRARPGSLHGVAAVVVLGFLAGFRPSIIQSFALLACIAVAGSIRRWRDLLLTVVAGAVAVAVWFVPMALSQPGGVAAWLHATRLEADGAAQATSILDHAPGGTTNLGTFAAFTVVALAPLAVVALLSAAALGARALARSRVARTKTGLLPDPSPEAPPGQPWVRPWYQSRTAVLGAALVPAVALVALVQFAKGGYLLAYLPAAVIALLLVPGALVRPQTAGGRVPVAWTVAATVAIVAVAGLGTQRFLSGNGVLPDRAVSSTGLWLRQPRYQAPYLDTRSAIRAIDAIDAGIAGLGPQVRAGRDVVVLDTPDGGASIYRNAGWELPADRIALIAPGRLLYNQQHGALYYAAGSSVVVGPAGSVVLVASPALPGLSSLVAEGSALPLRTHLPIGGYRVWKVVPGVTLLGVRFTERAGPRPLGRGL